MCLPSALAVWLSDELLARWDLAEVWVERGATAQRSAAPSNAIEEAQ
jgi:hypothetical protein